LLTIKVDHYKIIIGYCYPSVYVIKNVLLQSDHIFGIHCVTIFFLFVLLKILSQKPLLQSIIGCYAMPADEKLFLIPVPTLSRSDSAATACRVLCKRQKYHYFTVKSNQWCQCIDNVPLGGIYNFFLASVVLVKVKNN
jgi:hypothetical protein